MAVGGKRPVADFRWNRLKPGGKSQGFGREWPVFGGPVKADHHLKNPIYRADMEVHIHVQAGSKAVAKTAPRCGAVLAICDCVLRKHAMEGRISRAQLTHWACAWCFGVWWQALAWKTGRPKGL